MRLLIELISTQGLPASAQTQVQYLATSIKDITVKKASDVMDRVGSKHAGMRNLGCICYLLSVMQQFFMIPAFRQGILEVNFGFFFHVDKVDRYSCEA